MDRMINDPKSQHFITWTEHGTRFVIPFSLPRGVIDVVCYHSFVVSNVGEFSRNILGSHFKHNNVRVPAFILVST